MGFRFRKRLSLGGIAHVNFSLTGMSFSVGKPGATINLGGIGPNRKPRATIGLPGTGLYYTTPLVKGRGRRSRQVQQEPPPDLPAPQGSEAGVNIAAGIITAIIVIWILTWMFG